MKREENDLVDSMLLFQVLGPRDANTHASLFTCVAQWVQREQTQPRSGSQATPIKYNGCQCVGVDVDGRAAHTGAQNREMAGQSRRVEISRQRREADPWVAGLVVDTEGKFS